jgi:hypothetical protein
VRPALGDQYQQENIVIFSPEQYQKILAAAPNRVNQATASALKSEGWRIREVIKEAVEAGGPASDKWQPLNPHTAVFNKARKSARKGKRSRINAAASLMEEVNQATDTAKRPLERLAKGARYTYTPGAKTVTVGFITSRVMYLMKRAAEGFRTTITPKMRRMAFAIGFPLRKGTAAFISPPRSVVPQVFRAERTRIIGNVRDKVAANVLGQLIGKAGT